MRERDPEVRLNPSSVHRLLKREGLNRPAQQKPEDRRKYEAELANDIWQSDVMHGPMVRVGDKMRKSYLIAFLDDHSRLVPHAEFYLSEGLACFLDAFKMGLLKRGLPRKLYTDNGAAFRSRHLEQVCASLGIALVHARPYRPQGKGKIERFFGRVDRASLRVLRVRVWRRSMKPSICGLSAAITKSNTDRRGKLPLRDSPPTWSA